MKNNMKYYGFYRGQVVQCLNNGFCRIKIPSILEPIENDINTLPIAEIAQTIGGGGDTNNGRFTYPSVNSIVWCFFEGGNLERPVYFATSNSKSIMWNNVSIPTHENTNKGNDGKSVDPSGVLTQFNKTTIAQQVVLDKQSNEPIGDKIDLAVYCTSDQETMYNQAASTSGSENGLPAMVAAKVHLDNKRNTVTLTAKNTIILHAPNIVIDSTGFENPGYVLIKSDEIDNLTSNGLFRVMTSQVNIDGGTNDVLLQTEGEIHLNKSTSGVSEKSQQDYGVNNEEI